MLKDYWIEVEHFHVPNKNINEKVTKLGPYKSKFSAADQFTISYGLFDDMYMIGGTQILQWDNNTIRWRTNNIRETHRGEGLFYQFLSSIVKEDWNKNDWLIGWFRSSATWWPPRYNFQEYDGIIHSHDGDQYIMVKKPIIEIVNDCDKTWQVEF